LVPDQGTVKERQGPAQGFCAKNRGKCCRLRKVWKYQQ